MPYIKTDVEFEVFCDKCGAGLCGDTTVKGSSVYVAPCGSCLTEARDGGYENGYEEGKGERE